MADHKSFISSLYILFSKKHVFMMTFLVYIEYQNFTRIHIREIILNVLIPLEKWIAYKYGKHFDSCQRGNTLILDKVYSRSSFNQMWILKYWIFWTIVIIVLYQKFRLSKHVTFVHFTDHSTWECIKMFQNIIKNSVIFKMVRNVTN